MYNLLFNQRLLVAVKVDCDPRWTLSMISGVQILDSSFQVPTRTLPNHHPWPKNLSHSLVRIPNRIPRKNPTPVFLEKHNVLFISREPENTLMTLYKGRKKGVKPPKRGNNQPHKTKRTKTTKHHPQAPKTSLLLHIVWS